MVLCAHSQHHDGLLLDVCAWQLVFEIKQLLLGCLLSKSLFSRHRLLCLLIEVSMFWMWDGGFKAELFPVISKEKTPEIKCLHSSLMQWDCQQQYFPPRLKEWTLPKRSDLTDVSLCQGPKSRMLSRDGWLVSMEVIWLVGPVFPHDIRALICCPLWNSQVSAYRLIGWDSVVGL